MTNTVTRIERGWTGHFFCAHLCRFRRNTLLTYEGIELVVSTLGLMENALKGKGLGFEEDFTEIVDGRYYETLVFHTKKNDHRYHDADVSRGVRFDSSWSISIIDADDKANVMHETVVEEMIQKLIRGEVEK